MFQAIINSILKWECGQIVFVQNVFPPVERYLEILSYVTTAHFMQTYLFPLFLIFSVKQYVNVTIAAIISHISVVFLKWMLAGPRPYWWIKETNIYTDLTRPNIAQTYLTCEPSAGNPSGHVMVTTTVLFVILQSCLERKQLFQKEIFNQILRTFAWLAFILILCATTITRMFFGCHFFHQCFIGLCCGITISQSLKNEWLNKCLMELGKCKALIIAIGIGLFMAGVYFMHFLIGVDPQWAVRKAFNWCTDPYSIRPESTPLYAICSEFGLLLGLSLCAPLSKRIDVELSVKWSIPIVFSIMGLNFYVSSLIPRYSGAALFFVSIMAANSSFSFILLTIITKLGSKPKTD